MAMFMSGTADSRTTALLVSTAIRMIQVIGLNREYPYSGLNPIESEQRRRVFWIAFLLDMSSSISSGSSPILNEENHNVDLPSEKLLDDSADFGISTSMEITGAFRQRVELAIFESKICRHLFNTSCESNWSQEKRRRVLNFWGELKSWKEAVPQKIRPDTASSATTKDCPLPVLLLPVLLLHLTYYRCVDMLRSIVVKHDPPLLPALASLSQPRLWASEPADTARFTLRLLRCVKSLQLPELW